MINLISLATIGIIDYKHLKIPNVVLLAWVVTVMLIKYLTGTIPIEEIISIRRLLQAIMVIGIYFPLKSIVQCSAGDFKLSASLVIVLGLENSLLEIFFTNFISLFILANGIKVVPLGMISVFGYIALIIFKWEVV